MVPKELRGNTRPSSHPYKLPGPGVRATPPHLMTGHSVFWMLLTGASLGVAPRGLCMGSATDLYRDSHAQTGRATFQAVFSWVDAGAYKSSLPTHQPHHAFPRPLHPPALPFAA